MIKTNDSLPFVSCLCVTFARPSLLEEAIQSFLNQDYQGRKELIILNDFHMQTLSFDHPEVLVINLPKKVNTLGEKRNMIAALSSGDVLFPWDDDDICLPFRLSQSVGSLLESKAEYYKPYSAFLWNSDVISSIERYNFHAQCCYSRDLFNQIFYKATGAGEDLLFDNRVRDILGKEIRSEIAAHENFYLYRWAGTSSYHISAMDQEDGESQVLAQSVQSAVRNEIASGVIELIPSWKMDYLQQTKDFLTQL